MSACRYYCRPAARRPGQLNPAPSWNHVSRSSENARVQHRPVRLRGNVSLPQPVPRQSLPPVYWLNSALPFWWRDGCIASTFREVNSAMCHSHAGLDHTKMRQKTGRPEKYICPGSEPLLPLFSTTYKLVTMLSDTSPNGKATRLTGRSRAAAVVDDSTWHHKDNAASMCKIILIQ